MSPASVVDVLRRARARIEDPAKWLQGDYRDNTNQGHDDCAVCAIGAIRWALHGSPHLTVSLQQASIAAEYVAAVERVTQRPLADFNDSAVTTHADVLDAFDRAIALAEGCAS